jgi:hypothetical protein
MELPGIEIVEVEGVFTVTFPTPDVLKDAYKLEFFVIGMENSDFVLWNTDIEEVSRNGTITFKFSDVRLPLVVVTIAIPLDTAPTGIGNITIAAIAMFAFIAMSAGLWSHVVISKRKNARVSA